MNQPRDLPGLDEVKKLLADERTELEHQDDAFVFLVEGERERRPKLSRRSRIVRLIARKMRDI